MRSKRLILFFLCSLLVLAGCGAHAAVHPTPTPTRTPFVFPTATPSPTPVHASILTSGVTPLPDGPALFTVVNDDTLVALSLSDKTIYWRDQFQGGTYSFGSPVVADGAVYVALTDQSLYVLNARDGSLRWRYQAGGTFEGLAAANGEVFLAVRGGPSTGTLTALNARDGSLRWQQQLSASTLVVSDGVIYLGAADGIYALNTQDGSQRWSHPLKGGAASHLLLADGELYLVGMDGGLYSLNASDGSLRWQVVYGVIATAAPLLAAGDGCLYLEGIAGASPTVTPGSVEALDASTGTIRWPGTSVQAGALTASGGTLYVSGGYTVQALRASDGTLRWSANVVGSPDAWVSNGLLYVGSNNGSVYALNTGDGSIAWQTQLGGRITAFTLSQ